jgi:hypothetical protein
MYLNYMRICFLNLCARSRERKREAGREKEETDIEEGIIRKGRMRHARTREAETLHHHFACCVWAPVRADIEREM